MRTSILILMIIGGFLVSSRLHRHHRKRRFSNEFEGLYCGESANLQSEFDESKDSDSSISKVFSTQFNLALDNTICIKLQNIVHVLKYEKLEQHYPIETSYTFSIPLIDTNCKCHCTGIGGNDFCNVDKYSDDKNCTANGDFPTCYTKYHSVAAPIDCVVTSIPAKACCDIKMKPYNNKIYRAVKLSQPVNVMLISYSVYANNTGKMNRIFGNEHIKVVLNKGKEEFELNEHHKIGVRLTAPPPHQQLAAGMYYFSEDDHDDLREGAINGIGENNMEKIGWYRRIGNMWQTSANGLNVRNSHKLIIKNCKEQLHLDQFSGANNYVLRGTQYNDTSNDKRVIENSYVKSIRVDEMSRVVTITHEHGTTASVYLKTDSRPNLTKSQSQLSNFTGTITLDHDGNRMLNVTMYGVKGTVHIKFFENDRKTVATFACTAQFGTSTKDDGSKISLPSTIDKAQFVCILPDEQATKNEICKWIPYEEKAMRTPRQENSWSEGHSPCASSECNKMTRGASEWFPWLIDFDYLQSHNLGFGEWAKIGLHMALIAVCTLLLILVVQRHSSITSKKIIILGNNQSNKEQMIIHDSGPTDSTIDQHQTTSTSSYDSTPSQTQSTISAAFRPITSTSSYWPEPPPPYSPPITESWFSALNTPTTQPQPASDWFSMLDTKTSGTTPPVDQFLNNLLVQPSSQQVHHIHHNLHHHTHTHNVVQNHYFTTTTTVPQQQQPNDSVAIVPTPSTSEPAHFIDPAWNYLAAAPATQPTQIPFSDWKREEESVKKLNEATYPSNSNNNKKAEAIGSEKKHKQEIAKKMENAIKKEKATATASNVSVSVPTRIVVNGQPHSAPVVTKMPFSYRDVAARVEEKEANILSSGSNKENPPGSPPPPAIPTKLVKNNKKNDDLQKQHQIMNKKNVADELKKNNNKPRNDEFQKIQNNIKITAPENVVAPVASSRYDVLSLDSKNARNGHQSKKAAAKAAKRTPPVIEQVFSRSSSPGAENDQESEVEEVEDDDDEPTTEVSKTVGKRRSTSRHQTSKKKRAAVQTTQRRRQRRKVEPGWYDNFIWIWDILTWMAGYFGSMVQWTFQLIVDVCVKIYDVFCVSTEAVCQGILQGLKKCAIFIFMIFVYIGLSFWMFIRTIAMARLFEQLCDDRPEITEWGMKRDIPIPNSAIEYIDRLIRENTHDAYVVFGLRSECSDDEIKRNYKRLCALVSPDKCTIDGCEEAFDLLNRAFDAIGNPLARITYTMENAYDNDDHKCVINAWDDLRERIEETRCTIFCDCGSRHMRLMTNIRPNEARYCRRCDMNHPAKQNDIWVEKRLFGLKSIYLTCTDNMVFDITEWATCEGNLNEFSCQHSDEKIKKESIKKQ
ncbi:unnamed protein product [Caenorhabditis angaria]|uniref:J domain-containing protein n=1 Tax=Caenorhabditis angaria TaxID=860376 RepID=A0A9P1IBR9_9PELO|nr:unnamed protein product [Caenorhabditis angaria]